MSSNLQRVSRFDDERPVEQFKLETGNTIIGTLYDVETRSSPDFERKSYKYLTIDCERTGRLMGVPAWHYGLRKLIARHRPQIGERVHIAVGAKVKTKAGGTCFEYVLKVDRESVPTIDYSDDAALTGEEVATDTVRLQTGETLSFPKTGRPFDDDDDDDLPFS
jgi:hypothetical protein